MFTEDQALIIEMLSQGMTAKEIAAKRIRSKQTIKNTISLMLNQSGARNSSHLVYLFMKDQQDLIYLYMVEQEGEFLRYWKETHE